MKKESLEDKLDDKRSFTKSDWARLIPFYATYDAIRYGARNAFKTRGEAITYSFMWDISALQMYGLLSALVYKMVTG